MVTGLSRAEALDIHTKLAIVTGNRDVQRYVSRVATWSLGLDKPTAAALHLHKDVLEAPTYRMRASAMPELRERMDALDDNISFEQSGLPRTDKGVLVFEEAFNYLADPDAKARVVRIHILTWTMIELVTKETGATDRGYLFTVWNDASREPSTDVSRMRDEPWFEDTNRINQGLWISQFMMAGPTSMVGPEYSELTDKQRERVEQVRAEGETAEDVVSLYNIGRMLYAAFQMMNQPLPESDEPIERHARRRAARTGLVSSRVDDISVVNVRQHAGAHKPVQNPGTGHKLDHRVTVSEHWRNQAYGPGRKLRKRILIAEHPRGPEGTPVINKPRVHDVRG